MSLKQDLLTLNASFATNTPIQFPYSFEDVRSILFASVKFNKTHTFRGTLHPDTIDRLRNEGLAVQLDENGHTVVSWGLQ